MCSLQESYSSVGSGLVIFSKKTNMQFNFSDARITFLEGTHLLDREEPIKISQVTDLTLIGRGHWVRGPEETIMESTAVIYCTRGRGGFAIYDSSQISIINLSLINCGAFHTNAQVKSTLLFLKISELNLHYVSIQHAGVEIVCCSFADLRQFHY